MADIIFMYTPHTVPGHKLRMFLPKDYAIELFDPNRTYPDSTVFYYDMYGDFHNMIPEQLSRGHRIVFDAKNEHYLNTHLYWVIYSFMQHPGQGCFIISGHEPDPLPGVEIIATPYWYWIMDQFNFRGTGLDQQVRDFNIAHRFFMAISLPRPERDFLYDELGKDLLAQSIHSYRSRGVHLPNDRTDIAMWQRYVNPEWIDSTAFSLVVETYMYTNALSGLSLTRHNDWFLCEKSYKPCAAQHPFIMASTQGNLAYLRSQGFETFPELFDESYDNIPDWQARVRCIVQQVREIDIRTVDQPRVREKTRHNHALFFDQAVTRTHAESSIQQPLMRFVNA
jgi:hypothetical protein